jgi:hypothetical protein
VSPREEVLPCGNDSKAKPGLHDQGQKAAPQGEAFSFAANPPVKLASRLTGQAAKEKSFSASSLPALKCRLGRPCEAGFHRGAPWRFIFFSPE